MSTIYTLTTKKHKPNNVISIPVMVYNPKTTPDFYSPTISLAIWDTGCSRTAISMDLVKALGLTPCGDAGEISTGMGLYKESNLYRVSIAFENRLIFDNIEAAALPIGEPVKVAIGMDIIGKGDFAITIKDREAIASFRYPSQTPIDFTKE